MASLPISSTLEPLNGAGLAPRVSARRVLGEGALVGMLFGACVGGLMFLRDGGSQHFGESWWRLLELCGKTILTGAIVMTVYAALLLLIERRVGTARRGPLSHAAFRVWLVLPLVCGVIASLYAYFVMVYQPRQAIDFSGAGVIGGGVLLLVIFAVQRMLPPRVKTPPVSKPLASPWDED